MNVTQEINDIFWGTMMPITVLLGEEVTQIRARGSYSVRIIDQACFTQQVGAPADLSAQVRPVVGLRVTEVVGGASQGATDIGQLAAQAEALASAVQSQLEPDFNALGLTITRFGIQAIEVVGA
jgi:membrane protease subunit (stomatin/prohibitin family)